MGNRSRVERALIETVNIDHITRGIHLMLSLVFYRARY